MEVNPLIPGSEMIKKALKTLIFASLLLALVWMNGVRVDARSSLTPVDDPVTLVKVLPASGSYMAGQVFDVELYIQDVEDLMGAAIDLQFDNSRLIVLDENPGMPGVQVKPEEDLLTQPWIIAVNQVDHEHGTIAYDLTQLNHTINPPKDGSGTLFSFRLKALKPGPAQVAITTAELVNYPDIELIPNQTEDAAYVLTGADPIYLPSVFR
jgi:hypothetical protein